MTVYELYKYLQDLVETNSINCNAEIQVAEWEDNPYGGSKIVGVRTITDCDYSVQDDHNHYKETVFIIHE